jgi:hypothetical protein
LCQPLECFADWMNDLENLIEWENSSVEWSYIPLVPSPI